MSSPQTQQAMGFTPMSALSGDAGDRQIFVNFRGLAAGSGDGFQSQVRSAADTEAGIRGRGTLVEGFEYLKMARCGTGRRISAPRSSGAYSQA